MKRIYPLYAATLAAILAGSVLVLTPPTIVYACGGYALCQYGEAVTIPPGASSCSCTDNVGCTWTRDGKSYTQKCAAKGSDEELEIQ